MERKHLTADVGVIIGRFQVEELHAGHRELLNWVAREHSKVIVILGTPALHGKRNNPLDFQARCGMLLRYSHQLVVVPLEDQKYDAVWSRNLDTLVHALLLPAQTACLYGARDSFLEHYQGRYMAQELVGDKKLAGWSGTDQREKLRLPVGSCADWRAGVIWASQNQWPRVDTCVDIAIFDAKHEWMLVGRKPNENKYRFIGGFADPRSPTFEADALREVFEETNLVIPSENLQYIGSCIIDDWRYEGEADKIKTLLFTARAHSPDGHAVVPQAADDIEAVEWLKTNAIDRDYIVDTHHVLVNMLDKRGLITCV
jgi:bifunctional NMN adenylyltransferase/nudix hydrolase